ncbi:UNVERIFIED_CONTAM: hypothetical protein Sindi_2415700, partial [Sesamum indicum]
RARAGGAVFALARSCRRGSFRTGALAKAGLPARAPAASAQARAHTSAGASYTGARLLPIGLRARTSAVVGQAASAVDSFFQHAFSRRQCPQRQARVRTAAVSAQARARRRGCLRAPAVSAQACAHTLAGASCTGARLLPSACARAHRQWSGRRRLPPSA